MNFCYRVYIEDTDLGGIVYYANYLKFMERARTDWLRSLGYHQSQLQDSVQQLFIVSEVKCKYLSPARLDDELLVSVEILSITASSLIFKQQIYHKETGRRLSVGEVKVVAVSSQTMRPVRLSGELRQSCQTLLHTSTLKGEDTHRG